MKIILSKMETKNSNPVDYYLVDNENRIHLNELIGKKIKIEYLDEIYCIGCGAKTYKSFAQGFCYHCFKTSPYTEECVLKPELCLAHEGIARDMEYAENNCLKNHYVYLAVSSHLKVGVTRQSQVPTRWIDQGASSAIKLALAPNRYTAGLIEVDLKNHLSDKTSWQKMLKNEIDNSIDLNKEKNRISELLSSELQQYITSENEIYNFEYPVKKYPAKVKSINLDNTKIVENVLVGIKGRYLIFENDLVINIRKFGGYLVEFEY